MNTLCYSSPSLANNSFDPAQRSVSALRYKYNFVARLTGQMARQVQILAGEILMDKENFHGGRAAKKESRKPDGQHRIPKK
ncbi:hypothetical protein [Hydrogenophaga sp.]|uniref:hypothetical protein n=1 Tax=Hydrogenophaga sp. TaxID=1904254 RepID=UPI002715FECE|nr:hypothetical protein [Hydrogenophaga sp.]MDO9438528.1 hypothetical protein [Hydrogenophaga sp.]